MGFRLFTLISFFGLLYGLLGFNLYRLQIEKGDYYFKRVQARNILSEELELRRGQIFFTDRNQNEIPVAINRNRPVIYAVPKETKDPLRTAGQIAKVIDFKEEELAKILSNQESLFRLLVSKAREDQIEFFKTEKIKGVYVGEKQYRSYPFEKLSAHLIGFVGLNENNDSPTGLYGIEKLYNDHLAKGGILKLTIDRNIQAQAEQTLLNLINKFEAVGGTVIVQEPLTGKILTLANFPDFSPNEYSEFPIKNFLNPGVQSIYEPGSVFKPLTMAAGIDSGAITPETTFVDKGSVTLNGKTITNWDEKAYGKITMTNVIERSVNTGAVYAEQRIGHKNFLEYLKKFGFGEKTGIDLPEEEEGNIKHLERKEVRDIDFATAAFGQGGAVTPIQLVNAFSAIANGGLLMRPYVNGKEVPREIRRVLSEESAKQVTKMMGSAVEKAGVAKIAGYRVAGKTGTAQIPDFKKGGYTESFIHTYVGFAPASQPKFVLLLKLDKPKAQLAGFTVVPAFRELAEFILSYYNIPPDNISE